MLRILFSSRIRFIAEDRQLKQYEYELPLSEKDTEKFNTTR